LGRENKEGRDPVVPQSVNKNTPPHVRIEKSGKKDE